MKDPTPDRSARWSTDIRQLVAYALPNVSIGMLVLPAATIIPALYIKERALAPAVVGTILVVTRVFDAVADQMIGYLSDITRRRLPGGRKAWLVAGAALAIPSVLFLFSPPANVQPAYFAFWSLAVYTAWAMLLIQIGRAHV
jgi:Na+/melibiose symporter-like transporter